MSSGLLIRGGLVTLAASEENSLVALGGGDKMLPSDGPADQFAASGRKGGDL